MAEQYLRRDELMRDPWDNPLVALTPHPMTLYTDAFVVRGTLQTRHRRLTDALNAAGEPFVVVENATFEEFGSRALVERAPYAQINLSTVLFALTSEDVSPTPELRTYKVIQSALISLPPFRIVGQIHLVPEQGLREALEELHGRFIPVTAASFWSDRLSEPRTQAQMLAFNHARAQILAPYEERDPWAGGGGGLRGRRAHGSSSGRGEPEGRPPAA